MMALLAVFTGGEGLFAVVTGPAEFSSPKSFHGQGIIHVGAPLFFLEQGIMAVATTRSRTFVGIMIEHHGSEAFGILVHDFPGRVIRLNRRPTPQQTRRNKYRQTENPYSKCHRIPYQNDDPFEISFIIFRSPFQLKFVLFLQLGCRQSK